MSEPTDRADESRERAARLAAALRANLHRRKAQARARRTGETCQENAPETAQYGASDKGEASGDQS